MKNYRKTSDGKKGGLFVGKSHDKGGIPAIVVDTGQPIEVEGGEAIINKEATKKYWKELSKINQSAGNGNPIPPPQGFSDEVSQYSNGGKISKLAITEGTKHELEHRDTIAKFKKQGISDKEVARKIALDHLKENPNYYKVLKKLKLKKGGEIVCRSCGWSWLESENPKGENLYKCHKCNSDNKNFYKTGGAVENKKEVYDEWKTLVNMSASELKEFLKTEDGKKAGLTKEKADELGIGSGHESASWILKMKAVPYTQWSDTMWSWAKRQIGFIKRMSGNKGGLYEDNGNKTRKHTSLLIWGHNPEKFNGGGLIAPNGKPSNLTPEQYKLVRTPEFKAWFGDWENDPENSSKVVDENGEPLVVYHGSKSNEEFNVFKQSSRFEFIYFAKTKEYAWFHFTKDIIDKPFQLRPFFLNIRNLLNGEEYGFEKVDFSELKSFFYGIHELSKDIQLNPKSQYRFWEVLRFSNDIYDSLKNQDYYDGISFYENFYDNTTWNDTDDYSLSYVVMNPNQIKLADGINTTFDGNNPDIRFNGGGGIPKIKESYALVVKISNIDSPNEIRFKGTKNKYLGTYKKVFDILNEDSVFNEVYAIDDVLIDNDLYVFFESSFEADKYDKISKLKNVRIISVMSNGGRTIAQTPQIEFTSIENELAYNYLKRNSAFAKFKAKNGKYFYISLEKGYNPIVKIYDAEILNDSLKKGYGSDSIAVATFKVDDYNKNFSGYSENQSIMVNEEYRRIGIASAITDFTEQVLKMQYKPSKLLSQEMKEFVKNRFHFNKGGRTIAQTPAPKKDRIVGSEKNAPKSSESSKSAEKIVLSEQVLESIETILREYNKDTSKKVDLNTAKAVVRRGMGAYSSSHRPTISGGKPNSRVAWGLARLKAFLYKIENGESKSGKYSQDNDLIDDLGYEHEKFDNGGMTDDEAQLNVGDKVVEYKSLTPNQQKREYSTKGEIVSIQGALAKVIFEPNNYEEWIPIKDLKKIKEKFAKGNKIKAENQGGNCYEMAGKMAMGIMFADKDMSYPDFKGTPYVVHAEVSGQGAISGLRYGHAWVEDDMFIYDFSNGRKIVFPKELYYALGNVITKPPKYYKYTFNEARKKMSETGHYGSWELKTESGL